MGVAEQEGYLNSLVLHTLEGFADVDAEFAQLAHVVLVDIVDVPPIGHVEDNSHDSLTGSHWAVNLRVNLIDTH